jgi:DNA-binding MarR family transcriptional regulator
VAKSNSRQIMPNGLAPPAETIRFGVLADLIGFHLRVAQNASFRAIARRAGETPFHPGDFALLTLIDQNPGISQTALSRADGRDKSSLTPALNALEQRGLIRRERKLGNKRSYAMSLTRSGAEVLAQLSRHAAAHDRELDRIVGSDKPRLIKLLRCIVIELASDTRQSAENGERRRSTGGRGHG